MQTTELLSQHEIDALLDVFNASDQERGTDILFEVGMSKVGNGLELYFESLGLPFESLKVRKSTVREKSSYTYIPQYSYLEKIAIDNALALRILAIEFGAKTDNSALDRELTLLEKELLDDMCGEIAYLVEKELGNYLEKEAHSEPAADHSVLVVCGDEERAIRFSFAQRSVEPEKAALSEREDPAESSEKAKTKIAAVVGTIAADRLEVGRTYMLQPFSRNRTVLLLDEDLPFMATRHSQNGTTLAYTLQEAVTDKNMLCGHYVTIADTTIDDASLLELDRGSQLELTLYDEVQIHKDAKMVATAQLARSEGKPVVKVVDLVTKEIVNVEQ